MRRIAIVVRDLPSTLAGKLLASLDAVSRQKLRVELARLLDIDPNERRRALESFTGSMRREVRRDGQSRGAATAKSNGAYAAGDGVADTLELSGTRPSTHRGVASQIFPSSSQSSDVDRDANLASPVSDHFGTQLYGVSNADLMSLLKAERAQTVAVVLSKMPPKRAAALIKLMPPSRRQDVLVRIGRLPSIDESTIQDLAESFSQRVTQLAGESHTRELRALLGPLAVDLDRPPAPADSVARHIPDEALNASPRLRAILEEMPHVGESQPVRPAPNNLTDEPDPIARLRVVGDVDVSASTSDKKTVSVEPKRKVRGTDQIHQMLVALPPKVLCQSLARVPTRVAILALCGLPNDTADAAIACLPRSQANQVRRQLASMGSLELREIDDAKSTLIEAAIDAGDATEAAMPMTAAA
ncbi:MAG: FliG C-terminal domain-containing protein [Planctomycetota bacterium]